MFSFFKQKQLTFEQALAKTLKKDIRCCQGKNLRDPQLFSQISSALLIPEQKLIHKIAALLKLDTTDVLNIPDKSLIVMTGYSADKLTRHGIIPQARDNGYSLACSNPYALDLNMYRQHKIPVIICSHAIIEKSWETYQEKSEFNPAEETLIKALEILAKSALSLGGQMITFGKVDHDRYEIITPSRKFQGKLSSELINMLEAYMCSKFETEVPSSLNPSCHLFLQRCFHGTAYPLELIIKDENTIDTEELNKKSKNKTPHLAIVDDDRRYIELLKQIITKHGWQVTCYNDSRLALEELRDNGSIDLVISDVHMPGLNGWELAKELCSRRKRAPILMLTSDCDNDLEAQLINLGVDGFVNKQQSPAVLFAWCKNILQKSESNRSQYGS
ncbi:MAG: response regulator [Deltaproteobacteria bacterium]|nr:response regulator [Deltaproteobacteria bacterium]